MSRYLAIGLKLVGRPSLNVNPSNVLMSLYKLYIPRMLIQLDSQGLTNHLEV